MGLQTKPFKVRDKKKLKKVKSELLFEELLELDGHSDAVNAVIDQILQIRNFLIPKLLKSFDQLVGERVKVSEIKMQSVINKKTKAIDKETNALEKQLMRMKEN